jgi:hypothetical protein
LASILRVELSGPLVNFRIANRISGHGDIPPYFLLVLFLHGR